MAMKHALLGLLIEQPDYAGALERRFNERLSLWQPGSSPHADLRWLREHGYIRAIGQRAVGEGVHAMAVCYEVTREGRAFFEAWMLESGGAEAPPLRSELLMKVGFPAASDELLVRLYRDARRQEQWCVDRIEELSARGDLEALAQRGKDWSTISPVLVRDAEAAYLKATSDYLTTILREARRVYEQRTGRRLVAEE
jgi:DNA-binding PadR family transcriptional regulator